MKSASGWKGEKARGLDRTNVLPVTSVDGVGSTC